jgi:hypothetical protein
MVEVQNVGQSNLSILISLLVFPCYYIWVHTNCDMRFINLTRKIARWTSSCVRGSNKPSKPIRIKKIQSFNNQHDWLLSRHSIWLISESTFNMTDFWVYIQDDWFLSLHSIWLISESTFNMTDFWVYIQHDWFLSLHSTLLISDSTFNMTDFSVYIQYD